MGKASLVSDMVDVQVHNSDQRWNSFLFLLQALAFGNFMRMKFLQLQQFNTFSAKHTGLCTVLRHLKVCVVWSMIGYLGKKDHLD